MFKKMTLVITILLICSAVNASVSNALRVTEINSELISKIQRGEVQNLVVMFKEGDRLPVNLKAEGDLFESVDKNPTFVEVKKDFHLKVIGKNLSMSFDGVHFKPFNELARGSIFVGTNADDNNSENSPVGVINIIFSTFLR